MIVGIHPNKKHGKLGHDSQRFIDILRFNKIETELLYAGNSSFWDRVGKCSLFIFQWGHHDYYRQIAQSILPIIEKQLKIRCFPNLLSSWIYDDKIREYYLMKVHSFPIVESWIFYDRNNALSFIDEANYPLVFKLKCGAGSRMIKLLKEKSVARQYVKLMFRRGISYKRGLPGTFFDEIRSKDVFRLLRRKLGKVKRRISEGSVFYEEDWLTHKNYIYLQKFLPNNSYDTRVVVIGKRAFAFQRFNRPNDFRASASNLSVLDPKRIDLKFIEIAFQISKTLGFDSMAYDFLYDENKQPAIAEISYVFGSTYGSKISDCPGCWDDKLAWHEKPMEVSYCILSDLLNTSDLKMPATP